MDKTVVPGGFPHDEGVIIVDQNNNVVFRRNVPESFVENGKLDDALTKVLGDSGTDKRTVIKKRGRFYSVEVVDAEDGHEDGSARQRVLWIRDISAAAENERMLKYCLEILDNINEGVIVTDRDGRIVIYNKKLGEYEDLDQDNVIGRKLIDVYQWSMENSEHYRVMRTGEPIREDNYRTVTKSGKVKHLVASSYPIIEDGKIEAVYSVSRDVTSIREVYNRTINMRTADEKNPSKAQNGTSFTFDDIICRGDRMKKLISAAEKAAMGETPVLVYGETGTGKEMIVQGMHNRGPRSADPFVALNCAALPEALLESLIFGTKRGAFVGAEDTAGYFEQAGEGTLYFDNINLMPDNLQAKLLRALQEKKFRKLGDESELPVKCKIVSSTNIEPISCVEQGQLSQELFYRISAISLEVPPLRERPEDIEALLEHFISKYESVYGNRNITVDGELRKALSEYTWPGNVRELEHLIESAVSMLDDSGKLTVYNVPRYIRDRIYANRLVPDPQGGSTLNQIMNNVEKQVVMQALRSNDMNITKAAKVLGISRQNMQYRVDKLGLREMVKKERRNG